jgi:glycosyltransferase involved in cell wall biosynthesis
MPLTVLNIAFPFAPVGAGAVGGAEQILSDLDAALVDAGHTSLVAACNGSKPAGELFSIAVPERDTLDDATRARCKRHFQGAINRALAAYRVDLIHMHGLDFSEYSLPPDIPVLVTLHLPIAWYAKESWRKFGGRAHFCCVSHTQRRAYLAEGGPAESEDVSVVENGVDLPPLSNGQEKEDFVLVMGRVCPEKNAHAALEAGTRAGTRVLLAGQVFPYDEHQRYFRENIQPLLQSTHIFLGPVSPHAKHDLLARAKCLLHPTLARETSSLVAMEALAAGTPVIAYRSGALPEIVEDGVTGFLVDSVDEMAEAIHSVHAISPDACRAAAEKRFSKRRMVREYFGLYSILLQRADGQVACATPSNAI